MFIPTTLKDTPGLDAELSVWNAITYAFDQQTTLAIHQFPMFFSNGTGRQEIDILIINELLGVCVIEVKGLKIDQITSIQGHHWSYTNFYEAQGNPYKQAENQMLMLCNHLEKNPLLYRRLSKRIFVALPYISENQWQERGFHRQINTPLPLFKEDLTDLNHLVRKLQNFALSEAKGKLTMPELMMISEELGIQTTKVQQVVLGSRLPFSNLYIVQTSQDFERYKNDISNALSNGTKVYLLTYTKLELSDITDYKIHKKEFQLNVYESESSTKSPILSNRFVDGEHVTKDLLEQLAKHFPSFNGGQYKAIHQPIDANQIITAGAGTGKTHVMIDRILFLLINGGIPLKLVTMITFTNASTNEMKKRLENKFITLYNLTGQMRFLQFAEDVKDMQISTIHSFARSILKQLAHEIGYGQNVQLGSYKYEKKRIINELMDEFFSTRPIEDFLKIKVMDYEFIDLVYDMWEEMEKKGLTADEIKKINWGDASNEESTLIQEVLIFIFNNCETRLDGLKRADNKITMGDLIRKLKLLTNSGDRMKQLSKDHFIFVDEFQDSDSVQIELLASLQTYLQYRLFVVGDVKQAIYRFRGADYKSFQELQNATAGAAYEKTELQLNYRSSASLLDKMHQLFERWHKEGWLTYEKTDRLQSNKPAQFPNNDWHVSIDYKNDFEKALATLPDKKDKIAFIVRTNRQAKKIKEYCVSKNIPTSENLDGTFFTSPSVLHLKTLIDGLLYSHEPKFLLNALQTPYFGYVVPQHVLIPFGGHKERITSFIHERTKNELKQYVRLLRTLSPMTVIQKIIYDKKLFARLPLYLEQQSLHINKETAPSKEEIELAVLRYIKNLQHLMVLIERNFSSQHVTLQILRDWLGLQIKTNRTENEPLLEQDKAQVEITTVHRSKGLEYHTVFLPITDTPFNVVEQKYFLEEASEQTQKRANRRFGWKITWDKKQPDKPHINSHFEDLKEYEDKEQLKEETRLLYVALTRAMQRVYITMPSRKKFSNESWAYILKSGGLEAFQ
ncbi:UvrD-helicase domain-containing protein [Paenibacillus sp. JNUCC32]|uniref:UvrD-helicase domain-containing protein n=1 Tax=Paenibacillus sp. JNUCC32 TaxID=2777984 RepID=UPI0017886B85|nr:UvrD-helicase domain-containing protein [Paenibacillus sp. JNUCC-32]QOT08456.1 UvrD-helicase domain-containing protein [Paenibacillus sp. JNUCC-32]